MLWNTYSMYSPAQSLYAQNLYFTEGKLLPLLHLSKISMDTYGMLLKEVKSLYVCNYTPLLTTAGTLHIHRLH